MKLTTFILIMALTQVSAKTFSQITLNERNTNVIEVLKQIEKQSGFVFLYDFKDLNATKVSISVKDVSVNDALKACFENLPFTYTIGDTKTITIRHREQSFLENVIARFQTIDVKGRVVDSLGNGLPGASIKVKNGKGATTSNANGDFNLQNLDENAVLVITYVGYLTLEIKPKKDLGNIQLKFVNNNLQEVIVNKGYYSERKMLSTGNISSVKASEIEKQSINNPLLALQGMVAGVEINQYNGISGGAVKIQIRGINTFNQSTEPLFVIDGVPYSPNLFVTPANGGLATILGSGINPFSFINPSEIESIDILKDADATAIYGSRGANGVVLITTKKGKEGPTKVDINLQSGVGNISRKAKLLNTPQYLVMRKEAFKNDNVTPTVTNAKDLLTWDQNKYTDWQDVMIGGTSKYTDIQSSVSGGNRTTQYLIGGGYHRETTVYPGDWADQKGSLHFSINSSGFDNKLKLVLSGSYLGDNNQLPVTDYSQYITLAPNAPSLYKEDGSLDWTSFSLNPFKDKEIRYTAKADNLLGNGIISYDILPGLQVKSTFGYNNINLNEKRTAPISANNPSSGIVTGSASFNTNILKSWIVEPQINYSSKIGEGNLSVLFGSTFQNRTVEGQVVNGDGYTDDGFLTSLAGAAIISKGESVSEEYRYNSFFTRINFNWKDKYLLNLTGRRDGSSRFGPGRQYGNFGAVGAGWLFSNEEYIKTLLPSLSYGKLRASYGTSGNEPANNYQFLELYNFTDNNTYGGGTGIYPINLPDAVYSWEVNKKFEVGLEMGFFKDRLVLTSSFFRNRSSNQLVTYPLPSISGFSGITSNLDATIENRGWEFTFASVNVKNRNFEWKTGFNLTTTSNKLISFPNFEQSGYSSTYTIGKPINMIRVYHSAGVDPATGKYQVYEKDGKVTFTPNTVDDRVTQLNLSPKYYGGIQNTFTYKGFSLDVNVQFVKQLGLNYLFANSSNPGRFTSSSGQGNQPIAVLDRWQAAGDVSTFQKSSQNSAGFNSYKNGRSSDLAYSDASFMRFKNVSLSYDFTNNWLNKVRLQGLRIYLQAQNLFTITKFKGSDPETQSITVLPPLRVITAGIQITLK